MSPGASGTRMALCPSMEPGRAPAAFFLNEFSCCVSYYFLRPGQEQFFSESQGSDEKHPFGPWDDKAVLIICCLSSLSGFNFRGECLRGVDGDRATPLDAQPFLCASSFFLGQPRTWRCIAPTTVLALRQIHGSEVTDQSKSLPRWWDSQKGALETGHKLNGSGRAPPLTPSEKLEDR